MEDTLSAILGMMVSVLVSALVWITLGAGLYQLIRGRLHEIAELSQGAARRQHRRPSDTGPQMAQQQPVAGQ